MRIIIAIALAVCASISVCHAQQIPVRISVLGTAPKEIKITADREYPLTSLSAGIWEAKIKQPARGRQRWFEEADLVLTAGPGLPVYIPLRLSPETTRIDLTIKTSPTLSCTAANLEKVETDQSEVQSQIELYVLARDLYYSAQSACGSLSKRRAAKAWFDRSYSLATTRHFARLDRSALIAVRQILTEAEQADYKTEVDGYQIRLINDQKKAYIIDKKYDWACSLNKELSDTWNTLKPVDAKRLVDKLGYGPAQIEADGKLLETYLKAPANTCWSSKPSVVATIQP